MDNTEAQKLALAITKAIAYTENGGKVDLKNVKAGGSGELKSVFQFLPETWKRNAKEVTGDANLEVTPANEALVAHGIILKQVEKGLSEGKDPDTIAKEAGSVWNSGKSNSYKEGLKGVNKQGVAYDTPAYADKVAKYTNKFIADISGGQTVDDTHQTNADSGHATAVVKKFLTSVDVPVQKDDKEESVKAIAATDPLPQNNNFKQGVLNTPSQTGTNPGVFS